LDAKPNKAKKTIASLSAGSSPHHAEEAPQTFHRNSTDWRQGDNHLIEPTSVVKKVVPEKL
jgi:hypothetical protein